MGYTLDTGDTCMIVMISASFLIILCALCPSANVYMCIVQCLTYIVDHSDGSLPFHRWTNGQLPLETIEKPSSLMEKPLKNHWYQWFARPKTIEKPSSLMEKPLKNHWYQWLARPKPLKNHRYQWFARPKTIDTDGCFPTIHSKAQVNMKTLECCN